MAFNSPLTDNEIPSAAKWNTAAAAYERSTSAVDVVNTMTETTLYSRSIAAGHLSTDRMLRLTLLGDYLNNSGASVNLEVRLTFGATTMFGDLILAVSNAVRRPLRITAEVVALGATNSQRLAGVVYLGHPAAGALGGIGSLQTGMDPNASWDTGASALPFDGTAAVDSTVAQTLAVTGKHSVASTTVSIRKLYALLELI